MARSVIRILQASAAAICVMIAFPAYAADVCNQKSGEAITKIDDAFVPKINVTLKIIKALQDKGLDPRKYPVIMPDGNVEILDLVDLVEKLGEQRADGYKQINDAKNDCDKQIAPYQKIVDLGVFFSTGGLSAVLPDKFTHVDVSQILNGHPLGGDSALIPAARDQILNGLGIGGDVAKIIRDPKCIFGGC